MSAKRRRLMFSCTLCRDRKLKCGREHPYCARCVKAGKSDQCQYVAYNDNKGYTPEVPTLQSPDRSRRGSSACSWVNETEEVARVSTIVSICNRQSDSKVAPSAQHHNAARPSGPLSRASTYNQLPGSTSATHHDSAPNAFDAAQGERQIYLLKGTGFSARYFGPSHYTSTFITFADLALYTRDVQRKSLPMLRMIAKSRAEMKAYGKRNLPLTPARNISAGNLLETLPDRASMDRMIAYYLATFETTYRILHVPSFEKQYRDYLQNPTCTPITFLVILVLIMGNVVFLENEAKIEFVGMTSITQRQATEWLVMCDRWLQNQSFKRTTIAHYQIRILLWLGKRMSTSKTKRCWTQAGELVRVGMLAGLHREPSHASRPISVFDQEMRRRLWATIVELEAIACLDQGTRPTIFADDWDTERPSNIDDEGLLPDCEVLPSARPLNQFTRSSFLCICSSTIELRLNTIATINKIKSSVIPSEMHQYDMALREKLSQIPPWHRSPRDQNVSHLARSFLLIQLYEIMLLVHQSLVTPLKDHNGLSLSRSAFREAAVAQLEIQKNLPEQDSLLLSCLRTTGPRAAICLCYEISQAASSSMFSSDVTFNQSAALQLVEHAVECQTRKCIKTSVDMQPLFMMSCALSLAHEKVSLQSGMLDDKSKFREKALDRLSDLVKVFFDHKVKPSGKEQTLDIFNLSESDQTSSLAESNMFIPTPAASSILTERAPGPSDIPDNFDFDFGVPMLWDMDDFWVPQYPNLDDGLFT